MTIIAPAGPVIIKQPDHQQIRFEDIPSDILLAAAAHGVGKVFVAYHHGTYYAVDDDGACWKWPAAKLGDIR